MSYLPKLSPEVLNYTPPRFRVVYALGNNEERLDLVVPTDRSELLAYIVANPVIPAYETYIEGYSYSLKSSRDLFIDELLVDKLESLAREEQRV